MNPPDVRSYIGIGTNTGDKRENISRAVTLIAEAGINVVSQSSIIQTEPVEMLDQPHFLNCIVQADVSCSAVKLLALLLSIESNMGRVRTVSKGPRLIDLDLLLYGQEIISSSLLTVPHPEIQNRWFILKHLVELDKDLRCPINGNLYEEIYNEKFCNENR